MITLSMIVKNEEKYLKECLESVCRIIDEIVLVDTGSTDNTKKIAEEYGAKIFDFKWNNDFASARNYALSKSSGDWILYLDADERLDASSIQELKKLTSEKSQKGFYCRILNVDEINNRPSVMSYVRLFANSPDIKFEGKVHEQIENSLYKNGYELKNSRVEIIHVGYNLSKEELKEKAKRNIEILSVEYKENPTGYFAFQIGQTLHKLDREEEAVEYFLKALEDGSLRNEYKSTACRSIAIYHAGNSDFINAEKFINDSIKYDPQQPLSLLSYAKIYFKLGRIKEAIYSVKEALKFNRAYVSGKKVSSQNILIDQKVIIYFGLLMSLPGDNVHNVNYFLDELKAGSVSDEYKFYSELIKKKTIPSNIGDILKFIDDESIELLFDSISRVNDKSSVFQFLSTLEKKFKNSSYYYSKYGLLLYENSELDNAELMLKKSLQINPHEYSSVFYLISVYIKQNRIDKILNTINEHRHNFISKPQLVSKLEELEQKLKSIV